jgi:cell wall-associated NlpC family hydrolase
MSIAHDMVLAARECLGTPFQHQGRVPGVGLDCVGVAIYAARGVGLNPVDVQGYGETPNNGALRTALNSQPDLESVSLKDTAPRRGYTLIQVAKRASACRDMYR